MVALVALCLPTAAGAADQRATQDGEVTLRGRYLELHIDGADAHFESLLAVGDRQYHLHFPAMPSFRSGQLLEVTGTLDGDTVTVREAKVAGAAAAAVPTTGTARALVLLVHWGQPDSVTPASARDVVFGAGGAWYREVSYGRANLTGDVTPWLRIAAPATCDTGVITQRATAAARTAGFDAARYDRTVVYFPRTGLCGFTAMGGVGWGVSWLNGRMGLSTVVHELGHNYGLRHSHALHCTAGGAPVTLSGTCTSEEYGDMWDAMGYSRSDGAGHYNAAQKDLLGWTAGRKQVVAASGEYAVAPYEPSAVAVQALAVPVGGKTYWVEFRQPRGADGWLSRFTGATNGVVIHTPAAKGTDLLDMTPGSAYGMADSALPAGRSWTDPTGKLRITVRSVSPSGARVAISLAGSPPPSVPPTSTPVATPRPVNPAPAVGVVTSGLVAPSALSGTAVPVRLGWTATDPQGVCGQTLRHTLNGRSSPAPALTAAARGVVHSVTPGASRWDLTVRDCDGAQRMVSAAATPGLVQDSAIRSSRAWRRPVWTGYSGNAALVTTTRGAAVSLTFTGRSVGWVSTTGPLSGTARVYLDGVDQGRVDLRSAALAARRVVWSRSWARSGAHTLTIVAEGTAGRPRVTVDAITTLR